MGNSDRRSLKNHELTYGIALVHYFENLAAPLPHLDYALDGRQDPHDLAGFIRAFAEKNSLKQTEKALSFALEKHEGQYRSGEERLPYVCHPLMVAVSAIGLGFRSDDIVAACLLHDVLEDCDVLPEELPVEEGVRHSVMLLTRDRTAGDTEEVIQEYIDRLSGDRTAVIVKLLDRCSNISDMARGFSEERIQRYIDETCRFIYPLFKRAVELFPGDDARIMMIRYHMDSVLSMARR